MRRLVKLSLYAFVVISLMVLCAELVRRPILGAIRLRGTIEIMVKLRWPRSPAGEQYADLRIRNQGAVKRIVKDVARARQGRGAKWKVIGTCVFRRNRGRDAKLVLYARPHDQKDILIVKLRGLVFHHYYEFSGKLLDMIETHIGGRIFRERPIDRSYDGGGNQGNIVQSSSEGIWRERRRSPASTPATAGAGRYRKAAS